MLSLGLKFAVSSGPYARSIPSVPLYFKRSIVGDNASVDVLSNWYTDIYRTVQADALPTVNNICYFGDNIPYDNVVIDGLTLICKKAYFYSAVDFQASTTAPCYFYNDTIAEGSGRIGNYSNFYDNSSYAKPYDPAFAPSHVTFWGDSWLQYGSVGSYASFHDSSHVTNQDSIDNEYQAVGTYAKFYEDSHADLYWSMGDYATFNDNSYMVGMVNDYLGNHYTFNDFSMNSYNSNLGDYATFNDHACHVGNQIGNYAIFNNYTYAFSESSNFICDYATFNNHSFTDVNGDASIGNYATFNDYSHNYAVVGLDAIFNDYSYFDRNAWSGSLCSLGDVYLNGHGQLQVSGNMGGDVYYNMYSGGKAEVRDYIFFNDEANMLQNGNTTIGGFVEGNGFKRYGSDGIELTDWSIYDTGNVYAIDIPSTIKFYDYSSLNNDYITPVTINAEFHDYSVAGSYGTSNLNDAVFYDNSHNGGIVFNIAQFHDYSYNDGVCLNEASYFDYSHNNYWSNIGNFYNNSYSGSSSFSSFLNDGSFHDYSYNAGEIFNNSEFYDVSYNDLNTGVDIGSTTFYDYSHNEGHTAGVVTFNNYSYNNGVAFRDYVSPLSNTIAFHDHSYNTATGIIDIAQTSDCLVYYPAPRPLGGILLGPIEAIAYIGYP